MKTFWKSDQVKIGIEIKQFRFTMYFSNHSIGYSINSKKFQHCVVWYITWFLEGIEIRKCFSNKIHGILDSFLHPTLDFVPVFFRDESSRAPGHWTFEGTWELVVVFSGSLRHQVSVVGGGGVGHGSGAAAVEVAEVVGQHLQLVSRELAVIPENLTMIIMNTKIRQLL